MSILSRLFKRGAALHQDVVGGDLTVRGGEANRIVGASGALTLSAVYRCVSLISETVATLPLLHEKKRNGVYMAEDDRLSYLLSVAPNEWTSAFDFWRQVIQGRLLFGDSYIVPQYGDYSGLKRFVVARPGTAGPSTGIGLYMINDQEQGLSGVYHEEDVARIKGMSLDGVNCMSVISYAEQTLSVSSTAERNTLTNFANGGSSLGIITNESKVRGYGDLQTDVLQAAASKLSASLSRGDRLLALGGKWQYIPFTMTAQDMQILETRKFTVLDVCRFFNVPPSFCFADTSSNYKSSEMASVDLYRNAINPILRQIENELTRKLLPDTTSERIHFDREGIFASDLDAQMRYIERRVQTGTMTPNEARAALGKQPVEGGDALMLSANLKTIDELTNDSKDADQR